MIRYDQRDTGRSVTYDVGRPGYAGADMVADAARVLDGYAVPAAHVVGVSAGGALAQVLATRPPGPGAVARPDQHVLRHRGRPDAPSRPVGRAQPLLGDAAAGLDGQRRGRRLPGGVPARARRRAAPVRRAVRARHRPPRRGAGPELPVRPEPRADRGRRAPGQAVRRLRADARRPRHRRSAVSASSTARRWRARSRTHACSSWTGRGTASSRPTGSRSPRRSPSTPAAASSARARGRTPRGRARRGCGGRARAPA